jgi:hypothetical protein
VHTLARRAFLMVTSASMQKGLSQMEHGKDADGQVISIIQASCKDPIAPIRIFNLQQVPSQCIDEDGRV